MMRVQKTGRLSVVLLMAGLAVGSTSSGASAASPSHKKLKDEPKVQASGPAKPMLVGNYGDWGAYATEGGKAKICYALAQPKDRNPASLKKDHAYIFISNRPAEGVKNEVSVIMGVALKDGAAEAKAEVGTASFELVAKGQNAWVKNAADETRFIDALKKGSKLIVKGTLVKGGMATDSYSLSGLGQALDRVVKDCQ